jgi:hypothetical protein
LVAVAELVAEAELAVELVAEDAMRRNGDLNIKYGKEKENSVGRI